MKYLILLFIFLSTFLKADISYLTKEEQNYIKNKKVLNTHIEPSWYPFSYHEFGKPKGYLYDLQKLFAQKAGLELNVKKTTFDEAYNLLPNGNIDLILEMEFLTADELKLIQSERISLFYLEGILSKENITSFEQLVSKKVGFIKGLDFYWYHEEYKNKIEFIPYDTETELFEAILTNKVDAIVDNYDTLKQSNQFRNKNYNLNEVLVKNPDNHTYFPSVRKENKVLIDIFDKLITQEDIDNLQIKWGLKVDITHKNNLNLTQEEIEYLKNKKVLKVAVNPEFKPNYLGNKQGLIPDLMKYVGDTLNLEIQYIEEPWLKSLKSMEENRIDIIPAMSEKIAKNNGFSTTQGFYKDRFFLFAKGLKKQINSVEDLKGLKIAYNPNILILHKQLEKYKNDIDFVNINSENDAFDKIFSNEIDGYIGLEFDKYILNFFYSSNIIDNIIYLEELKANTVAAVRNDEPILHKILDKTIKNYPANLKNEILDKWFGTNEPSVIQTNKEVYVFKDKTNYSVLIVLGVLFIFLIVYLGVQQNKFNKNSQIDKSIHFKIFAITIILLLVLVYLIYNMLQEEKDSVYVMNISGKQRMLSQNLMVNANEYLQTKKLDVLNEYKSKINLMENDNNILLNRAYKNYAYKIYFEEPNIKKLVNEYLTSHKEFIKNPTEEKLSELLLLRKNLLPKLDATVKYHQDFAQRNLDNILLYIYFVFAMIFIITIFEVFYIFSPLVKNLREHTNEIENISKEQSTLLSLFDNGDAVLFKWNNDENWSIDYVSSNVQNLLGYTKEEFMNSSIKYADCINKDDMENIINEIETCKNSNENFFKHEAYRVITKDGKEKWVMDYTILHKDNEGNITHFLAYIIDITYNINSKIEAQVAQKRLDLATEVSNIGVWEWNVQTNEVYFSKTWKSMLGYKENEIKGHLDEWSSRVHPHDIHSAYIDVHKHLEGKTEVYENIHRMQNKEGEYIWIKDKGMIIKRDEEGNPLIFAGTHTDITAEKNALIEAQKLNEELSASEEKLRVQQEEILENQYQIETLAKAKEQFLANMSHEIRTPLNGIIGVVDMLFDEKDLNQSAIDKLNILLKSSNILKNIVNDILDYSSLQTGNIKLYPKEFSLKEMLNHIYSTFEKEFKEKNIKFNINVDSEVKDVIVADELRLSQILLNLLSNSKKFTKEGSVSLNIKSPYKNEKLQHLIIEVKDTGIGMSEDIKNNLFTPFTQGNQSNTKEYKGTGLGLTIVKKLVDIMGGQIDVYSMEDLGTTFKIKLKLEYSDKEIEHAKKDEIVILPQTKNALLVEDDKINQLVLRKTLEKRNFKIDILENGLEALNRLKEEHDYDIVFMDVQMPIMDGHEATRKIREFDKNIPIIALSAGVLPENIEQSLDAGMNMHIIKPIVKEEMNSVLEKFFS